MMRTNSSSVSRGHNLLAGFVSVLSVAVLYSSFDPVPAGEDVASQYRPLPVMSDLDIVPLPPGTATVAPAVPLNVADPAAADTVAAESPSTASLRHCIALLNQGHRLMQSVTDYTADFHKEERIGGDLQEAQTISLKVQHAPHFAVYMKWQNGERGRQVLFSEAYDDGCMVVKFGGLKRILPAIRVDPNCSQAMAESRYPVTQAGVLGMSRKILQHREHDLTLGDAVICEHLPDQTFDERVCHQFRIRYASPEVNETYRKCLILVDAERHIPLMVRSHTWSRDSGSVSEDELDGMTLIESYSFTRVNVSSGLVAMDFSRENPSYRM
ncbi:MAG: DUF1571 domain-containing protein [Planctomycetaceae bacterium]